MSTLGILAVLIVVSLVTSWVRRVTRQPARPSTDGSRTLVFGKRYLAMGLIAFLGGTGIVLWAAIKFGFSSPGDLFPFGVTLAIFLLGGGWMSLDALRTRVRISQEGITSVLPFRKPKSMTWQQIERVDYNFLCSWLVLYAPGKPRIRVSRYMVGFYDLIQALRDHISPTAQSGTLSLFGSGR